MIVDVGLYIDGMRQTTQEDISALVDIARQKGGYVWIGLAEPTEAEFNHVVGELKFHPLVIEDAI